MQLSGSFGDVWMPLQGAPSRPQTCPCTPAPRSSLTRIDRRSLSAALTGQLCSIWRCSHSLFAQNMHIRLMQDSVHWEDCPYAAFARRVSGIPKARIYRLLSAVEKGGCD